MLSNVTRAVVPQIEQSYTALRAQFRRAVYAIVSAYLSDPEARVTSYRNQFRDVVEEFLTASFYRAYADSGGEETSAEDEQWLEDEIDRQAGYIPGLFESLKEQRDKGIDPAEEATRRADGWAVSLDGTYAGGRMSGDGNMMLTFKLLGTPAKEPCADCRYYTDQRHPARWWLARGLVERPNSAFTCGRFEHCHHGFLLDSGELYAK